MTKKFMISAGRPLDTARRHVVNTGRQFVITGRLLLITGSPFFILRKTFRSVRKTTGNGRIRIKLITAGKSRVHAYLRK